MSNVVEADVFVTIPHLVAQLLLIRSQFRALRAERDREPLPERDPPSPGGWHREPTGGFGVKTKRGSRLLKGTSQWEAFLTT
jgi:hypothetical protein